MGVRSVPAAHHDQVIRICTDEVAQVLKGMWYRHQAERRRHCKGQLIFKSYNTGLQ